MERVDHGEEALEGEWEREVDAGGHAGLGEGEGEGDQPDPQHVAAGAQVWQGEGERGEDQEAGVHHSQHNQKPKQLIKESKCVQKWQWRRALKYLIN